MAVRLKRANERGLEGRRARGRQGGEDSRAGGYEGSREAERRGREGWRARVRQGLAGRWASWLGIHGPAGTLVPT